MALNARKAPRGGTSITVMEAGAYPARLVQVIDIGLQPQQFNNEEKPPKNEIHTTYEFLDEFLVGEDGEPNEEKPRWLSENFALNNLASDKAKSTQRYYALDPNEEEEGDWSRLIGKPCIVTIVVKKDKKGIERNYIASVSGMRPKEAAKARELVNPPKVFSMDDPDLEIFGSLPDWLQDKIKNSLEYGGSPLEKALRTSGKSKAKAEEKAKEDLDDNIPFDDEANEVELAHAAEDW